MLYFDHSATTPIHPDVLNLMNSIQVDVYGNPSSVHKQGRRAKAIIEKARNQVAQAIGAESNQIIFTGGGSEANNQILWSILNWDKKHVIASTIEHPAVTKVLEQLKSLEIDSDLASVDQSGQVSMKNIQALIRNDTALITVMLANNEMGTIQPIRKIVQLAHEKNILVHTDAVQCLGKMPLNIKELGVDFLSLSAHKFYGPKGIGIIFAKDKKTISPLIIGGGQESNLRAGTENIVSIAGMGLAAEIAEKHLTELISKLKTLENQFMQGLKSFFSSAVFNGNSENKLPGLVSVSFPGYRSDILLAKLDRANIAVSSGSACGAGDVKPSSVLYAMGLDDETNISTLRFSFGSSNSSNQVAQLLTELKTILKG